MLVQGARGCGVSPNARERGGRPLTECTVVGRAVDLDPVAHNHQVGGHLCALVCLHLDVLPVLIDRQVLQVAHPLTCGGYRDRKLAEAGPTPRLTVGKVITPPRDASLGPLFLPHPQATECGHLVPRGSIWRKVPERCWRESKPSFPSSRKHYSTEGPFLLWMAACPSRPSKRPPAQHRRESIQLAATCKTCRKPCVLDPETKHGMYASALEMEVGGLQVQSPPW